MSPFRSSAVRLVIPAAFSILILYLLYSRIEPSALLDGMTGIRPGWAAAYVVLACLEPLVRAARWRALLGGGRLGTFVRGMYLGKACNNILPLRMGDAVRVQFLRDRGGVPYRRAVASLLGETLIDLGFLALLAVAFALLSLERHGSVLVAGMGLLALLGLAAAGLALLRGRGAGRGGIAGLILAVTGQLGDMASRDRRAAVAAMTLLLWTHTLVTAWCGLRMLLPSVTPAGVAGSIVLVYFAALIPSAPGFIGSYHAAVAASLEVMGYRFADYPSLPILVHALQFVPQVIAGMIPGLGYLHGNDWRRAAAELAESRRRIMKGGA